MLEFDEDPSLIDPDLALAAEAALKLSGHPDAPKDYLEDLAGSILPPTTNSDIPDLNIRLESLQALARVLKTKKDPRSLMYRDDVVELMRPQVAVALAKLPQKQRLPMIPNRALKRSFYTSSELRQAVKNKQEPHIANSLSDLLYFVSPRDITVSPNPQRLSFSPVNSTNKYIEMPNLEACLILAGISSETGKEVSTVGLITPEFLQPGTELYEGFPDVKDAFFRSTLEHSRRFGLVGGYYPSVDYTARGRQDRKTYKEIIRKVTSFFEENGMSLFGPALTGVAPSTELFYLTSERRAIIVNADKNFSVFEPFNLRNINSESWKWRTWYDRSIGDLMGLFRINPYR